jgi:hypothetical protein
VTGEVVNLDDRRPRLHMMTAAQQDDALAEIRSARRERDKAIGEAYQRFNSLIQAYVAADVPVTDIADAAEMSRQRVYQIRDGK